MSKIHNIFGVKLTFCVYIKEKIRLKFLYISKAGIKYTMKYSM